MLHFKDCYQLVIAKKTTRKILNTYPKNLTQPSLVRKSYLYRGTPPRIKIKNIISKLNLIVKKRG